MKSKLLLLISMLVVASMLVTSCQTTEPTEAPVVNEPDADTEPKNRMRLSQSPSVFGMDLVHLKMLS